MVRRGFNYLKLIGIVVAVIFAVIIVTRSSISIESFDAVITINDSGDMTVVERWDMTYNERMNVRFRDIKYNKYAAGYPLSISPINKAYFDEDNVAVRFFHDDEDLTYLARVAYSFNGEYDELGYPIECLPNVQYCESIFIDATNARGLEGNVAFEYTYTILGAITKYSDISELNWRIFEYSEAKIKVAHIEVNFPVNGLSEDSILVWGHGLSQGTIEIASNRQVVMDMKNIKDGEFPEFRILVDNSLFPNIDSDNEFITSSMNKQVLMDYEARLAEETNSRIMIATVVLIATIAMVGLMGAITYYIYVKYDKEYEPEFKGDYFRELPSEDTPAEVSYLVFMKKINDETIPATLLDLIRKKFITIGNYGTDMTSSKADFELKIDADKKKTNLLSHEVHFLNWIFNKIGNGSVVTTKQIENFGKTDVNKARDFQNHAKIFVKLAKKEAEKKKYFEYGFEVKKSKAFMAILLPMILLGTSFITTMSYNIDNTISILICIVISIIYSIYILSIKKRSVLGNEVYTKWNAFKKFMLDFSRMDDYPIPGIIVWEHYIVYATVFKIADKVSEQLKVKLPQDEFDNKDSTFMGRSYYSRGFFYGSMIHNLHTTFTIAKMNSTSTIVAANAAKIGSSGGGGGFGGGSSFGGGGGGGRSR